MNLECRVMPSELPAPLNFQTFRIWPIHSVGNLEDAKRCFGIGSTGSTGSLTPKFGDWIYERCYNVIPQQRRLSPSGFGSIPDDVEDDLFLLRLFRSGDLAYPLHAITDPKGTVSIRYPCRTSSYLHSLLKWRIRPSDCPLFDKFKATSIASPVWHSDWFNTARRWFMYGGAKEFNPEQQELDRIADYAAAIEAALVPEKDFVSRRFRERAAAILDPPPERDWAKAIRELYDLRSTLVHGDTVSGSAIANSRSRWEQWEELVRKILVQALWMTPADEADRAGYLDSLFAITDTDRAASLKCDFHKVRDPAIRTQLLIDGGCCVSRQK